MWSNSSTDPLFTTATSASATGTATDTSSSTPFISAAPPPSTSMRFCSLLEAKGNWGTLLFLVDDAVAVAVAVDNAVAAVTSDSGAATSGTAVGDPVRDSVAVAVAASGAAAAAAAAATTATGTWLTLSIVSFGSIIEIPLVVFFLRESLLDMNWCD